MPGHAWPYLPLTSSPLPNFFETVSGCRGPEDSARLETSLVVSRPACRFVLETLIEASATKRPPLSHAGSDTLADSPPRSLMLLQVPGCSSFGKSGPSCMAPRGRGRPADCNLGEQPRSSGSRLRKHLVSEAESPCGYIYRSGLLTRSRYSVRLFWTPPAKSERHR